MNNDQTIKPTSDAEEVVVPANVDVSVDRFTQMKAALSESPYINSSLFDVDNSPQSQALNWIVNQQISIDDEFLLQRFSLGVLFFSTGGESSWQNKDKWMSEDGYCSWYGVECFDQVKVGNANVLSLNLTGNRSEERRVGKEC